MMDAQTPPKTSSMRRRDAAKMTTKKSSIEKELRTLKRKYYPGDGTSLQNGEVSLKSIADKKTKGKFKRAQELDDVPSNDRKRRLVDVVQDGNRSIPIGMKSGRRYTGEEDVPLRDTLGVRFFFVICIAS